MGSEPRKGNHSTRNKLGASETLEPKSGTKVALISKFDKATKNKSSMTPKVLETWIKETLQDAEHLDIPGVILKPE